VTGNADAARKAAQVRDLILGGQRAAMIHAVARCGVPDLLADGPVDLAALAKRSGTVAPLLGRILRALAASGLFEQTADGAWALTSLGEMLRRDHSDSLYPVVIYAGQPWMRDAWGELEYGLRTGEVPFQRAHGTSYFEFLNRHPQDRRIFDSVMASNQLPRVATLSAAYDWSRFGHIVDVGGGQGILLAHLLRAHPGLSGTVFELPEIASAAQRSADWEGLADRMTAVAGNFFTDVPPHPCDAIILSRILHDWPDADCLQILHNCRAALELGATLLVLEQVIDPGPGQRAAKEVDVHMHVLLGGKERSGDEFAALFAASGFALADIVATGTTTHIVIGHAI
jgi:hypothetical protein